MDEWRDNEEETHFEPTEMAWCVFEKKDNNMRCGCYCAIQYSTT